MKTFNNFIEITENSISKTEENDIINFTSPLSITDDSRQWNMTKYDIPSLDISHYDGLVTVNHGQDIADVVGKVINLRKDEQGHKVLIDGIRFAVNSNPVAILAKNLMKDGFVTGVSIETLGGEADQTGTWLGHKLCGLSIVAHPNNLNAYATIGNYRQAVANSIQEAQKNGLDTTKIENAAKDLEESKSIYFFDKKNYNSNMESAQETVKKNSNRLTSLLDRVKNASGSGGNPWHDELGRFTFSPVGSLVYKGYGKGYLDSRGNHVPSSSRGSWQGSYVRETDKAKLEVDFGYMHNKDTDEWTHAEDIDEETFNKSLEESINQFRDGVKQEYQRRVANKKAEEAATIRKKELTETRTEKFKKLSENQINKLAAKYEKELRQANPKAEARLKKGQEIKQLAAIATREGSFDDDGHRFGEWRLNGTSKNDGEVGRITKHISDGDAYISGGTTDYNSAVYDLRYHSDSKSVSNSLSTDVDDFNGVPTSNVNYTQLYNKMVQEIARNKAINELLK